MIALIKAGELEEAVTAYRHALPQQASLAEASVEDARAYFARGPT